MNKIKTPPDSRIPIALIDDDKVLNAMLSEYLQQEGFQVDSFYNGEEALAAIHSPSQYQAIVLDIMMPKINGLEVLQQLRKTLQTPIIMVTGRGDDIDKILGLEMGADDYLAKPCNPRELLARIKAIIRRSQIDITSKVLLDAPLNIAGICLNAKARKVSVNQQTLALTSVEFSVLQLLMQSAGEPVSKEQLSRDVLQRELSAYDRSIDVHVSRIRKKLDQLLNTENPIKTLRGQGYLFSHEV
ncbi:MAG: response regulator transcription factor [Pseudomonadales bacterium]|nr:response regulator transcription factor [Pseudomonadales bacterium]